MNSKRFENVIKSHKLVLVDFYTDWCVPCRKLEAVLNEVKKDFKIGVRIIKVNVDRNPFIATNYNIKGVPTIMLFRKGNVLWKGQGVKSSMELKEVLNTHL